MITIIIIIIATVILISDKDGEIRIKLHCLMMIQLLINFLITMGGNQD